MVGVESEVAKIIEAATLAREMELRELRAQPLNLPPLTKIFVKSLEEVHQASLTPLMLIQAMNLSTTVLAITQIRRELTAGRILAVCEEAFVIVGNVIDRPKWVALDRWIWSLTSPSADADFWETGYLKVVIPETEGRTGSQGAFELFGVRFSLNHLAKSSEVAPAAEQQGEQARPTTQLSKADAERFSNAILTGWPDCTENFAIEKARAFFPDSKVPRDWFYQIFRLIRGPTKRGKKPNNAD